MLLWRLSSARRAADFDGGFGVFNDGRWNTRGRAVTYCSTVPSVIVPIANAPDRNILINHRAANVSAIRIEATTPFTLDPRLFKP